jgi:hypothetical protein
LCCSWQSGGVGGAGGINSESKFLIFSHLAATSPAMHGGEMPTSCCHDSSATVSRGTAARRWLGTHECTLICPQAPALTLFFDGEDMENLCTPSSTCIKKLALVVIGCRGVHYQEAACNVILMVFLKVMMLCS